MDTFHRLGELTTRLVIEERALAAARLLQCLHATENDYSAASREFRRWFGSTPSAGIVERHIPTHIRAAVPAGSSAAGAWGSGLVPDEIGSALLQYAAPFGVVGRLPLQRAPFNTRMITGLLPLAAGGFVAAGDAMIAIKGNLSGTSLPALTFAVFSVVSKELLRLGRPATDVALRDQLARAIATGLDRVFFSTSAAVTDASPAGVLNGAPSITSSGSPADQDDAILDLQALLDLFVERGGNLSTAVFVLPSVLAAALALSDRLGFSRLTREGGILAGCPAYCSDNVGDTITLLDTSKVLLADDEQAEIAIAQGAAIAMDDGPTMDARSATASNVTSLFQSNAAAVRASRYINWTVLSGGVAYIEDANYTGVSAGSPQ